jgi:hypothetical protein
MRNISIAVAIAAIGTMTLQPAHPQTAKPKSPAEIAKASEEMTEKNNKCRQLANEQKLHLVKRQKFLRECRKQP